MTTNTTTLTYGRDAGDAFLVRMHRACDALGLFGEIEVIATHEESCSFTRDVGDCDCDPSFVFVVRRDVAP